MTFSLEIRKKFFHLDIFRRMRTIQILLPILFIPCFCLAQKTDKEVRGDKLFENFFYTKAIDVYQETTGLTTDGARNLGDAYRATSKYKEAEKQYKIVVASSDYVPEDLFTYAELLKMNGNHEEGEEWMEKFHELNKEDGRGIRYHNDREAYKALKVDDGQFVIRNLIINSEQEDFGAVFYQNKVVFASSREGVKGVRRRWNGNQLPFLDIYIADRMANGELRDLALLGKNISGKFHEGPASFDSTGNFMVFTSDDYKSRSEDGTVKLQLMESKKENGRWSKPNRLALNSHEYSCGHGSLTIDGSVMYFSSDMPGGFGGADLYRVTRDTKGVWGKPVNLGPEINTEGNEMFPFVLSQKGLLFFASNGHVGLGGLDVFAVKMKDDTTFSKVKNLGVPVNSEKDDFALSTDSFGKVGYFSSNREGGKGDDDIYSFDMTRPLVFGVTIVGFSLDKVGNVLAGTEVSLYDEEGNLVETTTTDEDGAYSFSVDRGKNWEIVGEKDDYFTDRKVVSTDVSNDEVETTLNLEKDPGLSLLALITDSKNDSLLTDVSIVLTDNFTGKSESFKTDTSGSIFKPLIGKKIQERGSYNLEISKEGYFTKTLTYNVLFDQEGVYEIHKELDVSLDREVKDLSELVKLNPINFDLGKHNIRPDAALELDKIVTILNKYPNMIVELGAHTDCRGSKRSNQALSSRRAVSSAKYIQSKITTPERISGKGYGESQLLNDCACEGRVRSSCDEDRHAVNRRTEFKVISTGDDKVKVVD